MAKKYIILQDRIIASAAVDFHRELVPSRDSYPQVKGGGYWHYDEKLKEVTLYSYSQDFGAAHIDKLRISIKLGNFPQHWKDCTFYWSNLDSLEVALMNRILIE